MRIKPQSLPDRWYAYWLRKGGEFPRTSWGENLCHFVRTLFFWAPMRWFFFARTCKVIAPWTVVLFATQFTLFTTLPKLGAIVFLATSVFITGVMCLNQLKSARCAMERFARWFAKKITPAIKGMRCALGYKILRLPVWAFLTAGVIAIGLYFFTEITLLALIYICVCVGAVAGLTMLFKKMEKIDQRPKKHCEPGKFRKGALELVEVIEEFWRERVHKRICPSVEFPPDSLTASVIRERSS